MGSFAHAQSNAIPPEILTLTDLVLRGDVTESQIEQSAEEADRVVAGIPEEALRLSFQAQVLFLRAFADQGWGRPRRAEDRLEEARTYAEGSVRARPTSEGCRVLSDILSQLLDMRGVAYKMGNFRRAKESADRAVGLDPRNASAHLAAAAYYISAPTIAGGDVSRGLGHLERARALEAESTRVAFFSGIWAATAAAAQGRRADATRSLREAAAIYPHNWWLAKVAKDLDIALR